jgi:hypothetical protein
MIAVAAALVGLVSGPANAYSVQQAPRNADGGQRFADPDAAFDQMADDYQNGRTTTYGLGLRDRQDERRAIAGDQRARSFASDPSNPYACVDCRSELVDGVWLLRHDDDSDNQ